MTKQCSWYDEDDDSVPRCDKPATHYSCNYGLDKEINVCQEHKCRCKQPEVAPEDDDDRRTYCVHYGFNIAEQKRNCPTCQQNALLDAEKLEKAREKWRERLTVEREMWKKAHEDQMGKMMENKYAISASPTDDKELTCVVCQQGNCEGEVSFRNDTKFGQRYHIAVGFHRNCLANPPEKKEGWNLTLSDYHRTNLLSFLEATGYPYNNPNKVEPFELFHTGDWVGELWLMLEGRHKRDFQPNISADEHRQRVQYWLDAKLKEQVSDTENYKTWAKSMLGNFEAQRDEIHQILDGMSFDRKATNDDGSYGRELTIVERVKELADAYQAACRHEDELMAVKCICSSPDMHRYDCNIHGDIADEIVRIRKSEEK